MPAEDQYTGYSTGTVPDHGDLCDVGPVGIEEPAGGAAVGQLDQGFGDWPKRVDGPDGQVAVRAAPIAAQWLSLRAVGGRRRCRRWSWSTWSGVGVAGQDVVRGGRAPHPPAMDIDIAAVHGSPEGAVGLGFHAVEQAPAGVEPVQTIGPQGAVRIEIRDRGFIKELFEV
jgi:hypothetical protein